MPVLLNPNFEYRNPKQFPNPNDPISKTLAISCLKNWDFEHLNLLSSFVFQISNFRPKILGRFPTGYLYNKKEIK